MARVDKDNYYLNIAEAVLGRATCLRRNYGAVIVNNDRIVSTGYSGAPRGEQNCCDKGTCLRQELNIPAGERYELCCSVHAEQNAIIVAEREKMIGGTLYLVGVDAHTGEYVENTQPCALCKRFIKQAGILKVVIRKDKNKFKELLVGGMDW